MVKGCGLSAGKDPYGLVYDFDIDENEPARKLLPLRKRAHSDYRILQNHGKIFMNRMKADSSQALICPGKIWHDYHLGPLRHEGRQYSSRRSTGSSPLIHTVSAISLSDPSLKITL